MRAGRLKYQVRIEEPVESKDSFKATVVTWQCREKVWADIQPLSGREQLNDGQIKADVDTKIIIRTMSGLSPKLRMVYGERVFDIKYVPPVARFGSLLEIMCKEAA